MNQGKQSFLWRQPLNINGNATFTVLLRVQVVPGSIPGWALLLVLLIWWCCSVGRKT